MEMELAAQTKITERGVGVDLCHHRRSQTQ